MAAKLMLLAFTSYVFVVFYFLPDVSAQTKKHIPKKYLGYSELQTIIRKICVDLTLSL